MEFELDLAVELLGQRALEAAGRGEPGNFGIVRAGTSLVLMTASGLVGWGIVSAFQEKKAGRFFAAYLSAVAIHGIWNACAVGAGISTIGELIGKPEWLFNIIPAAICGMTVLGIGMFAVLIASNRKLRSVSLDLPVAQIEEKNNEEA